MAMGIIQRGATIKFGLSLATADVSDDVHACTLRVSYDEIVRRGTYGTPRNITYPGNANVEFVVNFDSTGLYSGSSLGAMVDSVAFAALFSATPSAPLLYFDVLFDEDAASGSNKRYTGTVSVLEAAKGGEVNSLRQVEYRFPVITITEASS